MDEPAFEKSKRKHNIHINSYKYRWLENNLTPYSLAYKPAEFRIWISSPLGDINIIINFTKKLKMKTKRNKITDDDDDCLSKHN